MALSVGEHMPVLDGSLINNRYRIIKEVGCGNFAKVYKCNDTKHPNSPPVAVKVLKRAYATDASFENDMLKVLRARGGDKRVVQMLDHFQTNRYPCFVFTLHGPTLRSRKLGLQRGQVGVEDIRRLTRDLLQTLSFVNHELKMVHTDLKPENILLADANAASDDFGSSYVVADFGSSSFHRPEKPDSDLISTRPYRAPEVVLGMTWSPKADVWSLASIIFECFYGGRLFEVHDDGEHLHKLEQRLGKLPLSFVKNSKHFRRFFDDKGNITARRAPGSNMSRTMQEVLKDEPELFDLLSQMLRFDPAQRISAHDALRHPFVMKSGSGGPASARVGAGAHQHAQGHHGNAANAAGAHRGSIDVLEKENAPGVKSTSAIPSTSSSTGNVVPAAAKASHVPANIPANINNNKNNNNVVPGLPKGAAAAAGPTTAVAGAGAKPAGAAAVPAVKLNGANAGLRPWHAEAAGRPSGRQPAGTSRRLF